MIRYLFLVILGGFLGVLGLLVGFLEVIAIIDPVGTKMADDGDPFGDPYIPLPQHLFFIVLTILLITTGGWLIVFSTKRAFERSK